VWRTRNRKQLRRKWSGKDISFEAVSKNSQCWSWGDVWRQTVPEAATGNARSLTVDSRVRRITSCENDEIPVTTVTLTQTLTIPITSTDILDGILLFTNSDICKSTHPFFWRGFFIHGTDAKISGNMQSRRFYAGPLIIHDTWMVMMMMMVMLLKLCFRSTL